MSRNIKNNSVKPKKTGMTHSNDDNLNNAEKNFNEINAKNIEAAKRVLEEYVSSSEDEEELDEKTILTSLYKNYDKPSENAAISANILENVLQSGAATCLICIGSIKHTNPVWSCRHCFCIFHLNCIQRWANDSVAQLKTQINNNIHERGYYTHMGEYVPPKKAPILHWCCPQCREEYAPTERPTQYECYCSKEINPKFNSWLIPHSCGDTCGKFLKPDCGHKCMLLCHPGACPPCSQYANISCVCGKSKSKTMRCSEKKWQCLEKCKKPLSCGKHFCENSCHENDCPPCKKTRLLSCECGSEKQQRNCSDLSWRCKKICGRAYNCGRHACKKVCHSDECGDCPLGLPRSCPCGKSKKIGPCNEVIDSCGDTCQKLLPCGHHTCTQRCHRGNCNLCLIVTKKKCRCGLYEKDFVCSKEFVCETKCKNIRDCGKHACNKKCCDGNCPPCDKICGKTLSCTKHKCQSICHNGPCYPCKLRTQINCCCGKTSKNVPCGRERTARIACMEPCRIPSKCHHPVQHRCHKYACPPCTKKCGLTNDTTGCTHICEARCHAAVKTRKKTIKNVTNYKDQFEFNKLPHPPCEQKLQVLCVGGHSEMELLCWNSKPIPCAQKCNRILRCGNHKCNRFCHAVADLHNMLEQTGCESCELGCMLARPKGCVHPCNRSCHLPPCAPCAAIIKNKCYCGLSQVVYKCSEYFAISGSEADIMERQQKLKSCGSRCMKNYPCGHRCTAICHPGDCPFPESCRKKIRVFCECKRIKTEVPCDRYRAGIQTLECDINCKEILEQIEAEKNELARKQRLEEETKNLIEVQKYEQKFNKRKYKKQKSTQDIKEKQMNWKIIGIYISISLAISFAIGVAFYSQ